MAVIKHQHLKTGVLWTTDDAGVHRVTAGDEVLVETRVDTLAELTYTEAVDERDTGKALREKERAHFDFERARWDGFGVRSTKNKGKGGKGGRGGV